MQGKTVLITGGTGSFGRTMARHLLERDCREVRIFSRDEAKQEAMRIDYADPRLKFYIGDVRERDSVATALAGRVDYLFHAAALKQVPSCEFFPLEAVRTNVLGSSNVIDCAVASGVDKLVCLSTDKAVYPINAMGMTKAVMEKVAQAASRRISESQTTVCCVRYGNVMYSRGSVIPLFVKQIREGRAITVTEPSMTRFMLALSEAVELVEFAFRNARQGDIFIRKAPACTIADLVTALKELFGAPDAQMQIIGMRHGEKLYETLANVDELARAEDMGDYYRVRMDGRDLNYASYFTEGDTEQSSLEDYHSHNTRRLTVPEVKALLLRLPEIRQELEAVQ